jgi:ion channel-forming bestrophin family protein
MVCHNQSIYIRLAVIIVFLVSFTLYGIEGIGEEIEDPFGKDENGNILLWPANTDIKIDAMLERLKTELRFVFERIDVHDWLIPGV